MHKFKAAFLLLVSYYFCPCRSLDPDEFKSKYCSQSQASFLYCNGVNLTSSEIEDIQNNEFVISNCSHVVFQSSELGVVNGNFFKKFPDAEEIRFAYSTFNLTSSKKVSKLEKLKRLVLRMCNVDKIDDGNIFESFENLESLIMELYLSENLTFSNKILEQNKKLRFLEIAAFKGRLNVNENFLSNLEDLKELNLRFLGDISTNLLKNNKKVEKVILSSDSLNDVPEELYIPETVKLLHLNDMKIQNISRKMFKNLKKLNVLNLSANNIRSFEVDTFEDLNNLNTLTISSNKLCDISKHHFEHLKILKKLDLRYNFLNVTIEDFQKLKDHNENLILLIEPQYTLE